jgi:F420-non-reducing hydrogenase small subunit
MADKPVENPSSMYWAAACGGCEISTLNIGDKILIVDEIFDLAFFPVSRISRLKTFKGIQTATSMFLFNGRSAL